MSTTLCDVMSSINNTSAQLTQHSSGVSHTSQQRSRAAGEQASSLQEINSAICEVASRTQENAERAKESNRLTGEARDSAQQGTAKMSELLSAMERINEASSSIANIIKVIDGIAFQTNLLALNAAVEAARAGRHGKGFAVVAEEVRTLAGRSAKAAKETEQLIESAIDAVGKGRDITDSAAKQLDDITGRIQNAATLVGEISDASAEQAQTISQIGNGLTQIESITQDNARSAQTTAGASSELLSQVEVLNQILARFTLDTNGSHRVAGTSASHGQETPQITL
jgi:methyl-accepting chemotaxis protein